MHIELIKAEEYYSPHALGWVVLVNGQPHHAPSKEEAEALVQSLTTCAWHLDESGEFWKTQCGETFQFTTGNPEDNGFSFCPYCGRRQVEP